mmetsp:Transcript_24041/g.57104  ORF Transcript_24041/g.57104 Transcript_24041/m.57104 type:complete len:505 (+) Transcript_24041:1000-2514(+)
MAGASSSAAASLPSGQLPGSGPEMGSNGGFGVLEVEQPLLEQTVAGRVKAALYALIAVGEANDRPGRPASLDLKVVKEVLKATRTVHAELNTEQPVKLKAMGIANLKVALAFAIADQLGCASLLVRERGIDEYKIAACIKIGKYVLTRVSRSVIDFPDCSRAAFEAEFAPVTMQAAAGVVAAASQSSAASARTPVPQRAVALPVGEGYEAMIELRALAARLTQQRDAGEAKIALLRTAVAEETLRRELAERGEAAERKRAEASECVANKIANKAIKAAKQECDKTIAASREEVGIAHSEQVRFGRETASAVSANRRLEAAHAKLVAERAAEHARELVDARHTHGRLSQLLREVERRFADTRAELQTVKGKASAATVEAAASARDAAQGKRRLARLVGSSALAERVLRRSEAGRSLAVERAKKLALQLAALSTMRGAGRRLSSRGSGARCPLSVRSSSRRPLAAKSANARWRTRAIASGSRKRPPTPLASGSAGPPRSRATRSTR